MDEFTISDESLGLSGFVGGNAPVQGQGHVFGYPFSFHARGGGWTCAIYLDRDYPWASDNYAGLEPDDAHDVFFLERGVAGFVHSGDDDNASYMPVEQAKQLIRTCAISFVQKMAPCSLLPPKQGEYISDKHTVHALRVLLLTAAKLYALASNRSLKEGKRALHDSVDAAAASSPATQDDRDVMQAALMEIARLPEQE